MGQRELCRPVYGRTRRARAGTPFRASASEWVCMRACRWAVQLSLHCSVRGRATVVAAMGVFAGSGMRGHRCHALVA